MSEWQTLPLEDCMTAIIDYRGKSPNKTTFGVPLITAKVVKGGRIETPDEFIAEADYEEWMSRGIPQAGDVVMTTEAPLGEVAQLDGRKVALAQRIITLRGKPGLLEQTFLKFLLQSKSVQEELRSRATGTTVVGIKQSELRKVNLTLPPYESQKCIGHILGTLDDKIELNRRMNETLEAMARAIFQSWFVDFDPVRAKASGESADSICQRLGLTPELLALFPDSLVDTELGEIPAGWTSRVFGDWLSRTIGGDWGVDVADDQHGVSVRIIRGTDMPKLKGGVSKNVPSRFVQASKFSSRKLQPEDIVLEVSGGSKDQPTGRGLRVTNEIMRVLGGSVVPASFCRLLRPTLPDTGLLLSLHLDAIYSAGKTWEYQNQSTGISNFQTAYFLEHEMVVDPGNPIIAAFNQLVSPLLSGKPSSEAGSLVELRDTLLPKLVSEESDSLGLGSRI